MSQTSAKVITFEEFVNWLPENSGIRYELHHGNIIKMAQPVGKHEEIKGFLTIKLSAMIDRLDSHLASEQKYLIIRGRRQGAGGRREEKNLKIGLFNF